MISLKICFFDFEKNGLVGFESIERPSGLAIDNVSFLVRVTSTVKRVISTFFLSILALTFIGCKNAIPKTEPRMVNALPGILYG